MAREWTLQQGCREECLKIRKKSETHRPFSRLATAHVGWTGGILPYLTYSKRLFGVVSLCLAVVARMCRVVPNFARFRISPELRIRCCRSPSWKHTADVCFTPKAETRLPASLQVEAVAVTSAEKRSSIIIDLRQTYTTRAPNTLFRTRQCRSDVSRWRKRRILHGGGRPNRQPVLVSHVDRRVFPQAAGAHCCELCIPVHHELLKNAIPLAYALLRPCPASRGLCRTHRL